MTDQSREEGYEKLFGSEGNRFTLVGEYADGETEDLRVEGTFDSIQEYLDEHRDDLFNIFVAVHVKRLLTK